MTNPALPPLPADERTLSRQRLLTLIVVAVALWVVRGFLAPLAWAVVLAIAEWPLHRRLMRRLAGRPGLVALLLTLGTALLVILPLSLVAVSLAQESQAAIAWVQGVQQHGLAAPSWLAGLPLVGGKATQAWQQHLGSPQAASALLGGLSAGSVLGWLRSAAGTIASESGMFLITLVALFTMLAQGERLARQCKVVASRLLGEFGGRFVEKLTVAVRGTVNGTVLVSVAEGTLLGIGYVIAGVPQPVLFGTITVALAMIPFGAWAAFGLATLILLGQGHVLAGVLLFGGSVTVMTLGDNVVQPRVIGSTVELPFLLAIMGTVGGLESLGLVGLFVGPVVMVAALLIWEQWMNPPAATAAAADRSA
jgi:predicted PurR-regulated permease PerM